MFQLNRLLLPDPTQSIFDLARAQELLTLTDEAHELFDATKKKWNDWKTDKTAFPEIRPGFYEPRIDWSAYKLITHLIDKRKLGGELVGFIAKSNANPEEIFVVFRGTMTPKEWANNIRLIQDVTERDGVVEIHRGFHQSYIKGRVPLREQINNVLRSLLTTGQLTVFITGHSRGGVLATVTAHFLLRDLSFSPDNMFLYTFASPRVGDRDFARSLDGLLQHSFRIANSEDLVPKLPLASLVVAALGNLPFMGRIIPERFQDSGYEHIGQPIYFTTQKGNIPGNHTIPVYTDALDIK